jgi:hypothetical protein
MARNLPKSAPDTRCCGWSWLVVSGQVEAPELTGERSAAALGAGDCGEGFLRVSFHGGRQPLSLNEILGEGHRLYGDPVLVAEPRPSFDE